MTPPRSCASGHSSGRDRLLQREAQVVLAPPRGRVHRDADPQQPLGRGDEGLGQPPGHDPLVQQLLGVRRAEAGHRRPAPDAEVAHAAGAVLEIGLQQEDRVAEPAVTRLLLGAQARHEVVGRGLGDAGAERVQELLAQLDVARQEARVQQRRRGGQIAGRQRQRLIVRADGVSGVDLGVPQRVKNRLGQRLHVGARRLAAQDQQVQVGERRQLGAPEAARREDGDRRLAFRDLRAGGLDDQRVDVARQRGRNLDAVAAVLDGVPGPLARLGEGAAHVQVHRGQTLPPTASRD